MTKSKRSARSAAKKASTPLGPTPDEIDIGKSTKWPRYTEAERNLIVDFLAAWIEHASYARDRCAELANISGGEESYVNNVNYWKNAIKAFKWLIYQSQNRQRHLAIAKAFAKREGKS